MRLYEILTEKKQKRVGTMYHGTTDKFLRSILKQGLIINPNQRTYGDASDQFKTYPDGIYLTSRYESALDNAETASTVNGGDPIIIEIQYVIGSEEMDEDAITNIVAVEIPRLFSDDYRITVEEFLQELDENYTSAQQKFALAFLNSPKIKSIRLKAKNETIYQLFDFVTSELQNRAETNWMDFKNESIKNGVRLLFNRFRQDNEFVALVRILMREMSPKVGDYGDYPIRIPRNIGFSGKTKIKKIVNPETDQVLYDENTLRRNRRKKRVTEKNHMVAEGRDAPLYHFASPEKIQDLTNYDRLMGEWEHDLSQWIGKTVTGTSLTRDRRLLVQDTGKWCRIKLDQTKLAQKHRFLPVEGDYAHYHAGRLSPSELKMVSQTMGDNRLYKFRNRDWAEEFLLGTVKDAHKYIMEISINETSGEWIYADHNPVHRYRMFEQLLKYGLIDYANRFSIPLNFYDGKPFDIDELEQLKKDPMVKTYIKGVNRNRMRSL